MQVFAAPAITGVSGTISDGSNVTITGSGFGNKTAVAPLKWDNFEKGANGNNIIGWELSSAGGGYPPQYSNSILRTNSIMSGKARFIDKTWESSFGFTGTPFSKIYIDAWYYYDAVPPYSRNHKIFRIHSNAYSPNLYYNIYCDATGNWSHLSQDGVNGGNYHVWTNPGANYFAKQWVHLQAYFAESSPGTDNGTAILWVDGVKRVSEIGNFRTRNDNTSYWSDLWFGNYLGHDAAGSCSAYGDAYTYWDNVYVDTTQARVEISDSPVWNDSVKNHKEIQIPSSWSDSSITITANQGTFIPAQTVYLYVIDANGNVNANGYPVTISGDSVPDAISPQVSITSPSANSTVSSTITVSADATDNVAISGVQFKLDDNNLGVEDISFPYAINWDTTQTANSSHVLTAVAKDTAGNFTVSVPIAVMVNNLTSTSTISTSTIIIDNSDPANTFQGTWVPSTYYPGYYGSNYLYSANQAGLWYEWHATALVPNATYQVYARWTTGPTSNRPTDVSYQITGTSQGTVIVSNINQNQNGGEWNLLGTWTFTSSNASIRVISSALGTDGTCADAIQFVPIDTLPDTAPPAPPSGLQIQ